MGPGITKTVTLSDVWQRLGSLYDTNNPKTLQEGKSIANRVWISVSSNGAEVAFADSQPVAGVTQGHALASGDSTNWNNQGFISRAWFRNDTAGSNAVLTITPIFDN